MYSIIFTDHAEERIEERVTKSNLLNHSNFQVEKIKKLIINSANRQNRLFETPTRIYENIKEFTISYIIVDYPESNSRSIVSFMEIEFKKNKLPNHLQTQIYKDNMKRDNLSYRRNKQDLKNYDNKDYDLIDYNWRNELLEYVQDNEFI